jgi:hypothetical protein
MWYGPGSTTSLLWTQVANGALQGYRSRCIAISASDFRKFRGLPNVGVSRVLTWSTWHRKVPSVGALFAPPAPIAYPVHVGLSDEFRFVQQHYGFGWLRGVVSGYLKHFHNSTIERSYRHLPWVTH